MARMLVSLLLVSVASPFAAPVIAPVAHATEATAVGDDDFLGEEAWVKFKLTHDGKTHEHPGYLAVAEEEMILTMGEGSAAHEVSLIVEVSDAGQWTAKVVYKVGDTTLVTASKDIRTKKWITFKSKDGKSRIDVHVDPDSKGGDDIEVDKGKGPLDGLR